MDWLIGIAPAKNAPEGAVALTPLGRKANSADRLRLLIGMTADEFVEAFPKRENAMDYTRGRALAKRLEGHVAVFGVDAWRFLGLPSARKFWETHETERARFYFLPHPSGKSRVYNASANRFRLRRVLCRKRGSTSTSTTTTSS